MSYSKTIIEGHLTRDIEMKYAQSGTAIANSAIAVSHKWKDATGQQKEEVMFLDVTFFGRTGEIANQYLRKGSHVMIDGRLKLDQWTSQDGQKRSKHSLTVENLQMLGDKDHAQGTPPNQGGQPNPNPQGGQPNQGGQGYAPPQGTPPNQGGYNNPNPNAGYGQNNQTPR